MYGYDRTISPIPSQITSIICSGAWVKKVKKVKNILFQQDHNIVCINQKHQHSLVKKRLHKRENPAEDGQPRYK